MAYNDGEEPRQNYLAGDDLWTLGTSAMGYAASLDEGRTWTRARIPTPKGIGALRADPWLALGPNPGEVYYGFLGTDPSSPGSATRYLVVARSTDGGRTFPEVSLVDTYDAEFVDEGCGFPDRITIDADRTSGRLFATWPGIDRRMCVATAGSFGEPWTPARLSNCTADFTAANGHVQVAPDGTAYVVTAEWSYQAGIVTYQLCLHARDARGEAWSVLGAFAEDSTPRGAQPAFGDSQMGLSVWHSFDIAADGALVVAFVDRAAVQVKCPPCDKPPCLRPCFAFVSHVYVAENAEGGDRAAWDYREVAPGVLEHQAQPALSAEGDHYAVSYYETVTELGGDPDLTTSIRVMTADRFPSLNGDWIPSVLSAEPFEPCPHLGGYFGDYIGIGLLDGEVIDLFFTAWTDARDGCLERWDFGSTYHQHTYGAISP
ncbi:MAG: exo-alpha-sialidase [Deltaproteobacteria bacterium]|nr:exo-alpha-sialidase [Deltaproteobacteria bacterium]